MGAPNMLDYIRWRGDLGLSQAPFNEVDALILARMSYVPFEDVVGPFSAPPVSLRDAASRVLALAGANGDGRSFRVENDRALLSLLAASERFSAMRLFGYINKIDHDAEEQFSAICASLDGFTFIAFRGTDGTLVGWKEDFNMCFERAVPAQRDAVEYLEAAAKTTRGPLRLTGHSKGGNLAVYSAAFAGRTMQRRILDVYNADGPGFMEDIIAGPGFAAIKDRVRTLIPQSSVIGMLLNREEKAQIVHSTELGIFQHNPYTWEVLGPAFVNEDELTHSSRYIDRTLSDWLANMEPGLRRGFIDACYDVLAVSDARTMRELLRGRNTLALVKSMTNIDETNKKLIAEGFSLLTDSVKRTMPSLADRLLRIAPSADKSAHAADAP